MAYEGPPAMCVAGDASKTVTLTFDPDMNTAAFPPGTQWVLTGDQGVHTFWANNWIDNHTLFLEFINTFPVSGPPFTLEYGPIHPGLLTHFGTMYPSWPPENLPLC